VFFDIISLPTALAGRLTNQQSKDRSTRVTKQHYDAGNDLYEVMLGPSMSYTCAYWKDAKNLDEAQTNKFNLIFRKLELEPGMKVADLGMGWGTAAAYMHANGKNLDVTGVSLSEEQVKWATDNLKKPGLKFIWQDYRDHCEDPSTMHTYDRVYSIGMLEHIGYKNLMSFFKCLKNLLKPEGLAVIHTIGEPDFVPASDPFLDTYIFPGAVIPAMSSIMPAVENDFIVEDFQNFGHDYARTLAAWGVNSQKFFKDNKNSAKYTPEFQRMWDYYLKMCEALFELRINQLWHFVLSPRPATRKRIQRQT
jgi:cyclopropane-fatty-acyl-phospholipid synthase